MWQEEQDSEDSYMHDSRKNLQSRNRISRELEYNLRIAYVKVQLLTEAKDTKVMSLSETL